MGFEVSGFSGGGQSLSPAQSSDPLKNLLPKGNALPRSLPPLSLPKDFSQGVAQQNTAAIRAKLKNENSASVAPFSFVLKNGGVLGGKDGGANGVTPVYRSFEVGASVRLSGGATLTGSQTYVPNRGGLSRSANSIELKKGPYGLGVSMPANGGSPTAIVRIPIAGLDGKIEATRNNKGGVDVSVKLELLP